MSILIEKADLSLESHQSAVKRMVEVMAQDPNGGNASLPAEVGEKLIEGLRNHPTTEIILAFHDSEPVGAAICFVGFSTFRAAPLLNLHDLIVMPTTRGQGIGKKLMQAVEDRAREIGCCTVTLEVDPANEIARKLYAAKGYVDSQLFLKKRLDESKSLPG